MKELWKNKYILKLVLIATFLVSLNLHAQNEVEEAESISAPSTGKDTVEKKLSQNINIVKKGDRYSIELRNADLGDVIRFFAYKYNLNIIADKDIKGMVTASLSNISIKEALRQILDSQGYTMIEVENVIRVKKKPTPTKHFKLRNISVNDIKEELTSLISSNGKLILDPNSNSIMVTDDDDHLRLIQKFINGVDIKGKQVFIEAKFLETTVGSVENLGIEWNIVASASGAKRPHTFPFRKTGAKSFYPDVGTEEGFSSPTGWPILTEGYSSDSDTTTTSFWTLGTLDFSQTQAVLQALLTDSNTKIISNPQVAAINNQKAEISISTEYPLPTYEINSDTGELTVSGYEYKDIGIILNVIPLITEDNYITMTIEPEVGTITDSVKGGVVELPIISSKKASTKVTIKDGQTIVIGGLISEDNSGVIKKVPLLGSIPLLGKLFSYKSKSNEKRELLIFVTPHIISPEGEKEAEKKEKERKVSLLYEEVQNLQEAGNYEQALLKLEEILNIKPQEERARQMLVAVEKKIAEKKRQEEIARKLAEAEDLYREGKYEQAQLLLGEVLKEDNKNTQAQKYLSLIKKKQEEQEKSKILWETGNDLLRIGKYEEAKAKFIEFKQLNPEDKKADKMITICEKKIEANKQRHIRELVKKGKKYYHRKEYDSALKIFKEVLSLEPQNKVAGNYVERINNIREKEKKQKEEKKVQQEIISEEIQTKINTLLKEAASAYERGDLDYARSLCNMVLQLQPENEVAQEYLKKIEVKSKKEVSLPTSEVKSQKHIAQRPEEEMEVKQKVKNLFDAGVKEFQKRNYESAISFFEKVLLEDPSNDEAYEYLEKCHQELIRIKEEEKEKKVSYLIDEGKGFIRDGQYDQAFDSFHQVLEIDPGNRTAQRYLKYLKNKISRIKSRQAKEVISQLARKQNQWISAELERADIYIQEGNYQQAKKILENILSVKKSDEALQLLKKLEIEEKKQVQQAEQKPDTSQRVSEQKDKSRRKKLTEVKKLYAQGVKLYKQGKYETALEKFNEVLNSGLDYKRKQIEKLCAICLEKIQKKEREKIVERKYQLALKYFNMALYSQAIKLLLEVIDIKPNYKQANKYLNMATQRMDVLGKLGEYEQSEVEN